MKKTFLSCFLLLLLGSAPVFSQRINDLTGINAHAIEPLDMQKRFSWVRVWHDWSNDMAYATNGDAVCPDVDAPSVWQFKWNPSISNQNGIKLYYDGYFKALGSRAVPVLKGIAPQMRGNTNFPVCWSMGALKPLEQKPFCLKEGEDWTNPDPTGCGLPALDKLPDTTAQRAPDTYIQHALWVSLFAAKYGQAGWTNDFADDYMHPNEEAPIIGREYIQYLEDNNEPNKSWMDSGSEQDFDHGNARIYFSPRQFAGMLKADLDGNNGNMTANGQPLGITHSSAGITPVMGGLTGLHGRYYHQMKQYQDISNWTPNFHHYCTDVTDAQNDINAFTAMTGEYSRFYIDLIVNNAGYGVSPEKDKLRDKLQWLKNGNGSAHPGIGKNFWLTEFGYDSYPQGGANNSGVEVKLDGAGSFDAQTVQGQWLVRGVLEAAASQAVDRMFLYELKDNPTGGNLSYDYSGLLTQGGKTKRAWYFVMTLKIILGEFTFKQKIVHSANTNAFGVRIRPAGSTDENAWTPANEELQLRVYEFINGDGRIYAIWSPTQANVTPFEVKITFPDPLNQPEYALSGAATLWQIKDLSEKGQRHNWSSHVSGQSITVNGDVLVSETPVFLHINKTYPSNYAPPAHVSNLNCNNDACCGSVGLDWPLGGATRNHLVFFREKQTNQPCPAFDFSTWTLFSNNIGPGKTSVTVTGLKPDQEYCFAVIPVSLSGGLVPDNLSAAPVTSCKAGICSNCLLNISDDQITVGENSDLTTERVSTLLGMKDGSVTCSEINPDDCNFDPQQGWYEWKNPETFPEANTFYIDFGDSPKLINAIYAQDWSGNGDLKIEFENCYCPGDWRPLPTLKMEGLGTCNGTGYFVKHFTTSVLVKRLRITKLEPQEIVRRVFFCGKDQDCPSGWPQQDAVTDFTADEIRNNSAVLRWTAARYNTLDPGEGFVDGYEIQLAQQTDEGGALVNPVTIIAPAGPLDVDAYYRLEGLAPATTYYADLNIKPYPCPVGLLSDPNAATRRTVFTTESDITPRSTGKQEELKSQTNEPFAVHLRPNPAGGNEVSVSITTGELETVILMDTNGRTLRKMSASGGSAILNLNGLPSGVYWVRTIRTDKTALTVMLLRP